jgi:NADPH:quinone reductase-like Zn-dependent oxidoreductase
VADGIRVVGTASPANHDYLRRLGAEPVDYHGDLVANLRSALPGGASAALVAVGGEAALLASAALVADRSRILTVAYDPAAEGLGIKRIGTQRSVARLQSLLDLYNAGKLRVEVSEVFPLSRAADAHRAIEAGHGRGKIVLVRGDA